MFAYKFYINTQKKNALMLRLTNNRKKAELNCGFYMAEENLMDVLSERPRPHNMKMRAMMLQWQSKIENIRIDLAMQGRVNEDVKVIKDLIGKDVLGRKEKIKKEEKEEKGEFVRWYLKFADTHVESGARTRGIYYHTLSKLRCFAPELDTLNFADITVGWLEEFDKFLSKTCRLNSRNLHLRNIRAVVKYAIRHDVDIRNPFDKMRLKTEKTEKRSLDVEDLRKIFTMEVEPYAEIYRDMFKLSFMLIGINPTDLFGLKEIDHDRVNYKRAKTHKPYSIKVEPEALEIIKRYRGNGNLLMLPERWKSPESFGAGANKALQSLGARPAARGRRRADEALFPRLSLYWARHTWATIAADLDVTDAVIAQALGHSGENRTTDIYIRRNPRKVDEANRRVLDWVLYGKR